jgi:hypothetical protein
MKEQLTGQEQEGKMLWSHKAKIFLRISFSNYADIHISFSSFFFGGIGV